MTGWADGCSRKVGRAGGCLHPTQYTQHLSLARKVKVLNPFGRLVSARQPIPPHHSVAVVVDEGAVVHVVICRGAQAQPSEHAVPRVVHFRMDQTKPRGPGHGQSGGEGEGWWAVVHLVRV